MKSTVPDEKWSKNSLLQELKASRQRELQLKAVMDNCPVPLFLRDTEGRYLLANKEYQRWYGKQEHETLGRTLEQVLSPERAAISRNRDREVLESGGLSDKELNWDFPDGVTRYTIGTKFPVFDETGIPIGVGGVRTDVTALRAAEAELGKAHAELEQRVEDRTRELQESERRFRDFAEGATDSFWEMDAGLRFTNMTHMLYSDSSTLSEVLGKTRWENVGADAYTDPVWVSHRQDMEAHRPFRSFEYQVTDTTNDVRRFSVSGSPIFDDNGVFKGYRGTASDITRRVMAEEKAQAASNQLTEAIEALSEGFIFFDADERFVICNSKYRELYAPTSDMLQPGVKFENWVRAYALSGRDLDAIGQEDEWLKERLQKYRNPTEPKESRLDDGSYIRTLEYRTASGGSAGLRVDVTESRRLEAALRESEGRFRDFAEATSDSFWEMDANLRFINTTLMQDSIRSTTTELIGNTRWGAAGADAHNDPHWSAHRQNMEAHRPFRNFEYWLDDKAGNARCISISGIPLFDDSDAFLGYRGGAMDVTNLKTAEESVRAALENAREADKAKQDFLANMSHELRTPLNAIMGFSEVIQMEFFGPLKNARYLDYATDISHSANHLLELVNDILDLSKIEAGKLELSLTDIDLAAVASAAMRELEGPMRKKSQHFSMDIDRNAATIHADGPAVRQMLTNLLSNAMKFTPENGSISLSVGMAAPDMVKITVADSGVGIPKSDIDKVLSPFGQSGDIKLAREGGTGLGLPIVGALAKLHDGTLEIDSEVGAGTRVHITLPKTPKSANTDHSG